MAGVFIAMAGAGTLCLPDYKAIIFPAGLLMVVLSQSELFTGRILLVNEVKGTELLKWWGTVYIGNLVGSIAIALMAFYANLPCNDYSFKVEAGWGELFLKAILCNMLVCMAVFLAKKTDTFISKAAVIYACISLFVLCGYEHCVANMFYLSIGVLDGQFGIPAALYNLAITTVGNIIGGIIIAKMVAKEE